MVIPQLILNNLSFQFPQSDFQLEAMTLSFEQQHYGIVGENGVGKSTLLKLITGELTPKSGLLQRQGRVMSLPQSTDHFPQTICIKDVLGVGRILAAMNRIQAGGLNEQDFALVENHWDIEARIQSALMKLDLWPLEINRPFTQLSGGQKTKILLAKTFIFPIDFLLMDEPTNNLDRATRQVLYDFVQSSDQGLIIVSHDRQLLNLMDCIIEVSAKGLKRYGGNYDFYHDNKAQEEQAIEQDYREAKKAVKKAQRSIQKTKEKHEQRQAKGKSLRQSGGQAKLILNSMKSRSEKTSSTLSTREKQMLDQVQSQLTQAKEKNTFGNEVDVNLSATAVPKSKMILSIENLCFRYSGSDKPLFNQFNLNFVGAERVALLGENGSGKSTLIRLMKGELRPDSGTVTLGASAIAFLDQQVNFLDQPLTLVDNFLKLNADATPFMAYSALASFGFRNISAEKRVEQLSGGERMRAGLAISLLSSQPPQLIVLDEPTNHLDLVSIEAIEKALCLYQGALLVISHDEQFLENIKISRRVRC